MRQVDGVSSCRIVPEAALTILSSIDLLSYTCARSTAIMNYTGTVRLCVRQQAICLQEVWGGEGAVQSYSSFYST